MTMPQQTGQFANMPTNLQPPGRNWPNPLPYMAGPGYQVGHALVGDLDDKAIGWGAKTIGKGTRDTFGMIVHLLNPLLNTLFYVVCASFGIGLFVMGLTVVFAGASVGGLARSAVTMVK